MLNFIIKMLQATSFAKAVGNDTTERYVKRRAKRKTANFIAKQFFK